MQFDPKAKPNYIDLEYESTNLDCDYDDAPASG
jgi:hypothetical protein